jgi:hypothetical protein
MSLVLEFLMPFILFGVESTVFERKLRSMLGENEAVRSLTFRDIVGANTGFNLSYLISGSGS